MSEPATNDVNAKVIGFIQNVRNNQDNLVQELDNLVTSCGKEEILNWRSDTKHKHNLLLEFVFIKQISLVERVVKEYGFDVNFQRASDGCTALHLSAWVKEPRITDLLMRLGADPKIKNNYNESCEELIATREKMQNIVWMDTELTALPEVFFTKNGPNPEILECAIIITDKNLNELARKSWVVHYDQEFMNSLSEWHQTNFASPEKGGNGLIEDVVKATTTKEQFENEAVAFIAEYCPKKSCPLAGSSVHNDREVLLLSYPKIYDYLHHRIIDVSTLYGITERWSPDLIADMYKSEKEIESQQPKKRLAHRAMDDIERSLHSCKLFRKHLFHQ